MNLLIKMVKFSILLLFLLVSQSYAQNSISISDETIQRDKYVDLLLTGTIAEQNISSLSIEILYNSKIIDIQYAIGGTNFAIHEERPGFTTDFSKLDSAKIVVTSYDASQISNGVICKLSVKGLVFNDSISYIKPIRIIINGIEVPSEFTLGRITVRGTLIYPNFPDNLSYGYPNPFNYEARFNFSIEKETAVKFILYTLTGIEVINSENSDGMFEVFKKDGNVKLDDLNSLQEGSYYLILRPKKYIIASGLYFLVMQTDRNVFNTNIIYSK